MDVSVEAALRTLSERIPGFSEAVENERRGLEYWTCLPPERYQGKDVLDLGCGIGAGSVALIERGANFVWGVDPALTSGLLDSLSILPRSRFTPCLVSREVFGDRRFDVVYSRFVTEHIMNLPEAFLTILDLLKPGGRFVGLHNNYYSPTGAHDFAFIWAVNPHEYTYYSKAVPCWESPDKCAMSAEFRRVVDQTLDGSVRTWILTPHDCQQCPYFHRAQLWGHLLYQDSFSQDYAGTFYKTNASGGLNKVTPFQLRQYLVEAGFKVDHWEPVMITNVPPPELLEVFTETDLRTVNILFAADTHADEDPVELDRFRFARTAEQ